MPSLEDMKTWRLGRSGLRSFTDAEGHLCLEQNRAKASKWAKLAREGHEVAWEFENPGGGYPGRILIDCEVAHVYGFVQGAAVVYRSTLSFASGHPPISIHRIPHLFWSTVAKARISIRSIATRKVPSAGGSTS